MNDDDAPPPPVIKSTIKARGGVTGHNVRYVLLSRLPAPLSLSLSSPCILVLARFLACKTMSVCHRGPSF